VLELAPAYTALISLAEVQRSEDAVGAAELALNGPLLPLLTPRHFSALVLSCHFTISP